MIDTVHAERHALMDAQQVEKELRRLWREMGDAEQPMMRARVLTLVIVVPDESESEMGELLAQLAERHPARNLLLLLGEEGADDQLDAAVTLLCSLRGRRLCAEQIRLHATGAARSRLPSAVRTLINGELPVVLWWAMPLAGAEPLLDELTPLADRLFFDSALLDAPAALRRALPRLRERHTLDLNWERLAGWRAIVAGFFDTPSHQSYLPRIEQVTIKSGDRAGAWLLAGWLASRLGWQLQAVSDEQWRFARDEMGVSVTFQRCEQAGVQSVKLRAGDATFSVAREGLSAACEAEVRGATSLQQVVHLEEEQAALLLSRALDRMSQKGAYQEALAVVQAALGEGSDG